MTQSPADIRRIVFVCRQPTGESLRSANALKKLEGVSLLGICAESADDERNGVFADLICVEDIHDVDQLIEGLRWS